MHEWYKKYRPTGLGDLVGQGDAGRVLNGFIERKAVPHALLFSGPSGCGKTTLARIIAARLGCPPTLEGDRVNPDFNEVNGGDSRGVDTVREIRSRMSRAAMGKCRLWVLDEAHKLTNDAQTALLKMLEDTPRHVYFIICTTDAGKLLTAIRTRCTEVGVRALKPSELMRVLTEVLERERVKPPITKDVLEAVCEACEGSARKALVMLEQVAGVKTEDERLEAIRQSDARREGIDLARLLIKPGVRWPEVAALVKKIEMEPEAVRHIVMGYAASVLLGGNPKMSERASLIINCFRDNFFDSKRAGLVLACWEVVRPG